MPGQVLKSVENNFTKGFVTEFTGLNFPENAATDVDNCQFSLVGDVTRRLGIDYEENYLLTNQSHTNMAVTSYKWNNAGGDGLTQIVVEQIGAALYFYKSSDATTTNPLSRTKLTQIVDLFNQGVGGATPDITLECQFSDGNGYLFVYHPSCEPFFCSYAGGVVTPTAIQLNIRDFTGTNEPAALVNIRPPSTVAIAQDHLYNLTNQGWTQGNPWSALSSTVKSPVSTLGNFVFQVPAGLPIVAGDLVRIYNNHEVFPGGLPYVPGGTTILSGTVISYGATDLTVNIFSYGGQLGPTNAYGDWGIAPLSHGFINTWATAEGSYPSNADVWWYFKNTSGVFDPATTQANVQLNTGPAPKGHFVLSAFNQNRSLISGVDGLTTVSTNLRPRTGTWFQGRVWYAGLDDAQIAGGTSNFYTWTENIYFSQIANDITQFGQCYQTNDPTSETLFDLLPTDGGVITIQGAGAIYKLFPIQNGMLVFASNGIWFITGSQGIGFAANDYTITKISSVQSISSTSFVDVQGLPYFWNEEGIYTVQPSKGGGLTVEPITVGTILSYYNDIPVSSKRYVRGAYDPIDYNIQWIFRNLETNTVSERYVYTKLLNFNTYNKAFSPYSVSYDETGPRINGIIYVNSPGGTDAPTPTFKYIASQGDTITFAEEYDEDLVDWGQTANLDYSSYFVTGYKLHGDAQRRFQLSYLYTYSRGDEPTSFYIQGLWDYATTGNSGRWSTAQLINNWSPNFGVIVRRHKIRGQGLVLQLKVSSIAGQPFDVMGWSAYETQNTGV